MLGVLCLIGLSAIPAHAMLWPNDPFRFYSVDMRLITIILQNDHHDAERREVRLEVPRAWVTIANGYDPGKLDELPDVVTTTRVEFELTEPDGEPLSVRALTLMQTKSMSLRAARDYLRAEDTRIELQHIPVKTTVWFYERLRQYGANSLPTEYGIDQSPTR